MAKLKFYEYKGCDTCRKAKKFLDANGIAYQPIPIRETPPAKTEIIKMLAVYDGNIRRLFSTSGVDYKQLKLSEKLPHLSSNEAINLLAANGNLVKRPFVISGCSGVVGFNEEEWQQFLP